MKLLKAHPILTIPNAYLIDSPAPSNLSYIWSFGSLLGTCLVLQIITGVTLAFHYVSSVDLAFSSVEHLTRDVTNGWLIRFLHANGAAFFFIFVYLHIGKAIYYGSYRSPRVLLWSIGVVIFLVMIVTAFLGYVLPFHPGASNLGLEFLEDTPHDWNGTHAAWNGGAYDQWVPQKGTTATLAWDGRDDAGRPLPVGVYLVEARWGAARATLRLARL